MSNAPMVDIVLATNRDSPHLQAALTAIRAQTYQAWQLIVVDDGVPDREALQRRLSEVPQTIVVSTDSKGVSGARNAGIRAGSGDLVAFHDDDDVWMPRKLERQVQSLQQSPQAVGSHTAGVFIDQEGKPFGDRWPATPSTSREFLSGAALLPRFVTLMIRRTVLADCGLFDVSYRLAEDLEFMLRLAQFGELTAIDEELIAYRRHHGNTSTSGALEGRISSVRLIEEHIASTTDEEIKDLLTINYASKKPAWAEETARGLITAARGGAPRALLAELRFALRVAPLLTLRTLASQTVERISSSRRPARTGAAQSRATSESESSRP